MRAGNRIRLGFLPLVDAAPLIVAKELGFAEREGLDLGLSRETSWATVRDRLSVGHLDASHSLAPLPIAANLGLGPLRVKMSVPVALGCGGNTVTVGNNLWTAMADAGATPDFDCARALNALKKVTVSRRARGAEKLVFAIVHQHSAHRYQLAYWLASAGLIPGRDVALIVLPPPLMPEALRSENIDGFCAGEPWGTVAAGMDCGRIVTTNSHIWRSSPEKVLTARDAWLDEDVERTDALVRAVWASSAWCDEPANIEALVELLARPEYVGSSVEQLRPGLLRKLAAPDRNLIHVNGIFNFSQSAAAFPWASHALWFVSQMARWKEVKLNTDSIRTGRQTFRPDIFRRALARLNVDMPAANSKVEGALPDDTPVGSSMGKLSLRADPFFDGRVFDPDQIEQYVSELMAADRQFADQDVIDSNS